MHASHPPRIAITTMVAARQPDPLIAARKNALCVDSVVRHGAAAMAVDASTTAADLGAAFATMDGLLLTGGADIDPARYGETHQGSEGVDHDRDELEHAAWRVAMSRGLPILGLCRGFQAMNAFAGGKLVQHVDGHAGPGWGLGAPLTHPIRLVAGSQLARIVTPIGRPTELVVNSYHHQAVRAVDLAPGLVASAFADSPMGEIVEGLEATDGPFRMAVQCHPERTESTPRVFEQLFAAFVEACRGPVRTW
jgi:putative glutamine amidotransferase